MHNPRSSMRFRALYQLMLLSTLLAMTGALTAVSGATSGNPTFVQPQAVLNKTFLPIVVKPRAASIPAPSAPSDQDLIAGALKAGRIDHGTALLYRFYALFADPRLPQEFRGNGSIGEDQSLFAEAADPALAADVQAKLRPFLVRPDHPESVHNTKQTVAEQKRAATPSALYCDENNWASLASAKPGVKVAIHAKCIGDYDYELRNALGHMESLWEPMTALMGQPLLDTGGRDGGFSNDIDMYLMDPLDKVWRANRNYALDGAPAVAPSAAPYTGVRSSGFMMIGRSMLRDHFFRSTLAHEFFHVLQHAHNRAIHYHGDTEWWYTEASAAWASAHFVQETAADYVHPWFAGVFQHDPDPLHLSVPNAKEEDAGKATRLYAAYIWPFFMEQEVGPQAIANSWKAIATAGSNWDRGLQAIDQQLPFAHNFHRFALRNLNDSFGGDNPLKTRYIDLDRTFPDGAMPDIEEIETLSGRDKNDPPLQYSHDLPSLKAHYYHFTFDETVKQVTFDFTKLQPLLDRKVGAVLKIKGQPWQMRELVPDTLHFCRDKPAEAIEDMWIVVSHHNTDITKKVTGPLEVKPFKDPCTCNPDVVSKVQAVNQWQGTLTFNYTTAGAGNNYTIRQQRSANLQVTLKPQPYGANSFIGSPIGTSGISDDKYFKDKLFLGVAGTGQPIPYDPASNNWSRITLNFKWDRCQYNFGSSTYLNATVTGGNSPPKQVPWDIGSLHSDNMPITGLVLAGSATFPAHSQEYILDHGGAFYDQPDYDLINILGEDNLGAATVTWRFTPVDPPTP